MFKFTSNLIIIAIAVIVSTVIFLVLAQPKNVSSVSIDTYSNCLNDPNTQFQVAMYKEKYSRLSTSSIADIICK